MLHASCVISESTQQLCKMEIVFPFYFAKRKQAFQGHPARAWGSLSLSHALNNVNHYSLFLTVGFSYQMGLFPQYHVYVNTSIQCLIVLGLQDAYFPSFKRLFWLKQLSLTRFNKF